MKVLVTGSAGRLGVETVKLLEREGHKVIGIDIVPSATTHHIINVTEKEAVAEITKEVDAVLHTAALHGKHYDLNYPREAFVTVNILGTLNLLDACVANGVKKFLYVSTTSIYGDSLADAKQAVWVDELLPARPRDIYDITKQAAEHLCRDFFYKERLQTSVYRVGRFLPESENLQLNHRLYRGLDERDGAKALCKALHSDFKDFEIFNIAGGSPFDKHELEDLKRSPREVILKHFPQAAALYAEREWQFPESIDRVYVSEKANRYFGFTAKYTFKYLVDELCDKPIG